MELINVGDSAAIRYMLEWQERHMDRPVSADDIIATIRDFVRRFAGQQDRDSVIAWCEEH